MLIFSHTSLFLRNSDGGCFFNAREKSGNFLFGL